MEEKEDKTGFSTYPQQVEKKAEVISSAKGRGSKPLVATRTCNVYFDECDCTVELVKGCEVHNRTRQEREYLLFWGYVE